MAKRIRALNSTLVAADFDGSEYLAFDGQGSDPTSKALLSELIDHIVDQVGSGGSTYEAVANSTGNSTIAPAAGVTLHWVEATITGSAGTRIFILPSTDRAAVDRIIINFHLPATAAIVIEIRNGTSGGTLLKTFTADSSLTTKCVAEFGFNGSAWKLGSWQQNLVSDI